MGISPIWIRSDSLPDLALLANPLDRWAFRPFELLIFTLFRPFHIGVSSAKQAEIALLASP